MTHVDPQTWRRWTISLLAVIGAGLSAYLAWMPTHDATLPGCGGASSLDCDHVLATRWSQWLGIPVSYPAVAVYLVIALTSWASQRPSPRLRDGSVWLLVLSSLLAAGASLWFLLLQLVVIGKFCLYCSVCHLCGISIAILVLWRVGEHQATGVPMAHLASAAAIGVALLVVGQLALPPTTYAIADTAELIRQDGIGPSTPLNLGHPPQSATRPPAAQTGTGHRVDGDSEPSLEDLSLAGQRPTPPRRAEPTSSPPSASSSDDAAAAIHRHTVTLADGSITIDLGAHPLLGSPEAPYIAVKLFDYTCHECREMFADFAQARQRYAGQLAIVVLPVPLNADCNCHIQHTRPHHKDDCRYARLALAVWHLDPREFVAYHYWLMAGDRPPPLADAVARAEQLFGREKLATALQSDAVSDRIRQYADLYATTGKWLPLILIEDKTIRGDLGPANELFRFLERYLGLTPTPST